MENTTLHLIFTTALHCVRYRFFCDRLHLSCLVPRVYRSSIWELYYKWVGLFDIIENYVCFVFHYYVYLSMLGLGLTYARKRGLSISSWVEILYNASTCITKQSSVKIRNWIVVDCNSMQRCLWFTISTCGNIRDHYWQRCKSVDAENSPKRSSNWSFALCCWEKASTVERSWLKITVDMKPWQITSNWLHPPEVHVHLM